MCMSHIIPDYLSGVRVHDMIPSCSGMFGTWLPLPAVTGSCHDVKWHRLLLARRDALEGLKEDVGMSEEALEQERGAALALHQQAR